MNGDADPLAGMIDRAAAGEREAQIGLSFYSLATVASEGVPQIEALVAAEAFAHLAAAQGGVNETLHLASVLISKSRTLLHLGETSRSTRTREDAEALLDWVTGAASDADKQALAAVLSDHADGGDERAAIRLNRLLEAAGPEHAAKLSSGATRKIQEAKEFSATVFNIINKRTV